MKIGVMSDTHLSSLESGLRLAKKLLAGPFKDVEMILHAGDHVMPDFDLCFDGLPYYGVRGNMDPADSMLPVRKILEIDATVIGMVHGWGPPAGLEERVFGCFDDVRLDVLIFGHSHRPLCRRQGEVLLLNPGSATDRRAAPNHTVAVLSLGQFVDAQIVAID